MSPRSLVVPALVCLIVGAALGTWGWGQRDASRQRMIEEAEARFEEDDDLLGPDGDGMFGPDASALPSPYEAACADILAAADLRLPGQLVPPGPEPGTSGEPGAPGGPAAPGAPQVPSEDLAPVLSSVLQPERVAGIVELDITEVHAAMATMRTAVVDASTAGRDLYEDPAVGVAGLQLRAAVAPLC